MGEAFIDKEGHYLLRLKNGQTFKSARFTSYDDAGRKSWLVSGTPTNIWACSLSTWSSFLDSLNEEILFEESYSIEAYEKPLVDNKAEEVISFIKSIVPEDCMLIFDNNVVIIFANVLREPATVYFNYLCVFMNSLTYKLFQGDTRGATPLRFTTTSGTTVFDTPIHQCYLSGYYLSNKETATFFNTPSVSAINGDNIFSSNQLYLGFDNSVVATRNNNPIYTARDSSYGMTFDNWSKLMLPFEINLPYVQNKAYLNMFSYYGNTDFTVSTDNPGGNSGTGGGNGTYDDTSDEIPIPSFPSTSASQTGMVTLLRPTLAQLSSFSNKMWGDFWTSVSKSTIFYGDPADIVINLSLVPVEVESGGTISDLKVAGASTGISMDRAGSQYEDVDCGTIHIDEYWGSFMDYAPYTKMELYLPFCGTIQIDPDEVMNSDLSIVYHIDLVTGSCIAFVKIVRGNLNSVLHQMNGNLSYNIPITGDNFGKLMSTLVSIATSGIATSSMNQANKSIASGHASVTNKQVVNANAVASAKSIATVANSVGEVMTSKPTVTRSGDLSANNGILGILKPYLIITRPKQSVPTSYPEHYGHLSNITETLSNLSGYTIIESIHLDGVSATQEEKDELEGLLYSGVIL